MIEYIHYNTSHFDKQREDNFIKPIMMGMDYENLINKQRKIESIQDRMPYSSVNRYYDLCKPIGLWGSRTEGTILNWKNWCIKENFYTEELEENFKFTLKEDAKILLIDSPKSLESNDNLIVDTGKYSRMDNIKYYPRLNLYYIMNNYDAIEVIHGKYYSYFHDCIKSNSGYHGILYWWDCDSICVWNYDKIIELGGEAK